MSHGISESSTDKVFLNAVSRSGRLIKSPRLPRVDKRIDGRTGGQTDKYPKLFWGFRRKREEISLSLLKCFQVSRLEVDCGFRANKRRVIAENSTSFIANVQLLAILKSSGTFACNFYVIKGTAFLSNKSSTACEELT